ncbi:MAG: hypothetical protein OEY59_11185 [Deltaproteobacteria bacterium]|nr:hypothetical protein [Deltaproteobacteria bacterium]
MKKLVKKFGKISTYELDKKIDTVLMLQGLAQVQRVGSLKHILGVEDIEFKVYSQWGEDGIIQFLIQHIDLPNKIFVEFGVENYTESSTRFLLKNNNWSGLVIDGSEENYQYIRNDEISWRYELDAICSFITRENINELISSRIKEKEIGLLSVDIDGMDYWVWEEIDCVEPAIVICEYNSLFGDQLEVVIPYRSDFIRSKAHVSNLYFGASIKAFIRLGKQKGYTFICTNSAGNNAFFVRDDLVNSKLSKLGLSKTFHKSKFREARDSNGQLLLKNTHELIHILNDKEIIDLQNGKNTTIRELYTKIT